MTADKGPAQPAFARAQAFIARRVTEAVAAIPADRIERAVEILLTSPEIFVYGAGRSGIIGRAFAMRLVQAGLAAFVIGESTTPIVRPGDAVFILSGQGESQSSIQTANIVRRVGAQLIVLTGRATSKLAHTANLSIPLEFPEDPERAELAPLGTLFESASLQFTDALVATILRRRGESEASMRQRHAIMV
jgi:6-phospho-3-hexuloisomerase